jgi:DNA repair exonuclease SbcCD nuclease subunit
MDKDIYTEKFLVMDFGDIHFGRGNTKDLYDEFEKNIIQFIVDNEKKLNMVVISGDYFDQEIKISSNNFYYAYSALEKVIWLCEKSNIAVRMIRGTATHDMNQVEAMGMIFKNYKVFRVITKTESEVLQNGMKILYIPEEYPKNMTEYYNDLIYSVPDNTYDMTFFHGTFDFQAFQNQVIESEKNIESAPVWKSEDIIRITKGPIAGGHIHVASDFKKKVFYHGSFSRSCFGEESPKGFNIFEYDTINNSFEYMFIENIDAPEYKDVDFDNIFLGYAGNIESVFKELDTISNEEGKKLFRINIGNEISKNNPEIRKICADWISNKTNITLNRVKGISLKTGKNEEDSKEELEENQFAFLSDNKLDVCEKIKIFIEKTKGKVIDISDVQRSIAKED